LAGETGPTVGVVVGILGVDGAVTNSLLTVEDWGEDVGMVCEEVAGAAGAPAEVERLGAANEMALLLTPREAGPRRRFRSTLALKLCDEPADADCARGGGGGGGDSLGGGG
jgi:hypothetical protein